jgi:hypothetical protein
MDRLEGRRAECGLQVAGQGQEVEEEERQVEEPPAAGQQSARHCLKHAGYTRISKQPTFEQKCNGISAGLGYVL